MLRRVICALWAMLLLAAVQAQAATYVVAPFKVNGPSGFAYLEKAIPPMLSSRLFWENNFTPAPSQDDALKGSAPADKNAAAALMKKAQADYVIWGSVTVLGEEASLDVNVLDGTGKVWQRAAKSPVNSLIGSLQNIADAINYDVFNRPMTSSRGQGQASSRVLNPVNPGFIMNETDAGTVYADPANRYGNNDQSYLRSQALSFESYSMAVGDFDGDRRQEVALLNKRSLFVYRWEESRLIQLAKYDFNLALNPLTVRSLPRGMSNLLVVNTYDTTTYEPSGFIMNLDGGKLNVMQDRIHMFLNVTPVSPNGPAVLVGQGSERTRVYYGKIYEMVETGGKFERGGALDLPKEATAMNFVWLPGSKESPAPHLVVLNDQENLLVFDEKGKRLAKTSEKYSGSGVAVRASHGMPGMGPLDPKDDIGTPFYMPESMLAIDLEGKGNYELLANHPVSTAAMFFENYRTYPQGEVEALVWDGLGLQVSWKTRRIKGSVADIAVADLVGDGSRQLIVCVNTYPGTFGTGDIRTMLTVYPLNSRFGN